MTALSRAIDYWCNAFTPDREAVWNDAIAAQGSAVKVHREDDGFCVPEEMAERLGAKKDKDAPSVDGNDVVYRHPAPEQLHNTQLSDGIELEIRSYYDPLFKPKGFPID